jgi:mRNA N6-methyladenine demethylase
MVQSIEKRKRKRAQGKGGAVAHIIPQRPSSQQQQLSKSTTTTNTRTNNKKEIQHNDICLVGANATTTTATTTEKLSSPLLVTKSSKSFQAKKQKTEAVAVTSSSSPPPPASHTSNYNHKKFITIQDGAVYHDLLKEHYCGFAYIAANQAPNYTNSSKNHNHNNISARNTFHTDSQRTLELLRDAGYYQYDIVMAGGQKLSRTFVQRTLVGEPGMTYKYLGLRLFAHAWRNHTTAATTNSNADAPKKHVKELVVSHLFRNVYNLNQAMIRMTQNEVQQYELRNGKTIPKSSYNYNITLINYMESYNETLLRDEEHYGMGKASVSWHADSSLQDYSCIGVYHTIPNEKGKGGSSTTVSNSSTDWKIALRPNPSSDQNTGSTITRKVDHHWKSKDVKTVSTTTAAATATVPPIVISTKSGDVYCLLDDFNHTHQHMVLAGSTGRRMSSTHRVAVTDTDTYTYIAQRCSHGLVSSKQELKKMSMFDWNISVLLEAQSILTEVEFDWIAQYWIQGTQHDVQHVWWQAPIRALEQAWNALEKVTYKVYTKIMDFTTTTTAAGILIAPPPPRELVMGLLSAFQTRQEWRVKWDHRRGDKIYPRRISRPYQPVEHPIFHKHANNNNNNNTNPKQQLPKDLSDAIQSLSKLLNVTTTISKLVIPTTNHKHSRTGTTKLRRGK